MEFLLELETITALKISDGIKPINKDIEVFQTWQIYNIPRETDADQKHYIRLGFSSKYALKEGLKLKKNKAIQINDILIMMDLPDLKPTDAPKRFQIDIHHWEADSSKSTVKVKKVFQNEFLKNIISANDEGNKDEEEAKLELQKLTEDKEKLDNVIESLGEVAANAVPWVALSKALVPFVLGIGKLASNNSADFIGQQSFRLEFRNNNGEYQKRLYMDAKDAGSEWTSALGLTGYKDLQIRNASGKIQLATDYLTVIKD